MSECNFLTVITGDETASHIGISASMSRILKKAIPDGSCTVFWAKKASGYIAVDMLNKFHKRLKLNNPTTINEFGYIIRFLNKFNDDFIIKIV
jgi:hypothetical protein